MNWCAVSEGVLAGAFSGVIVAFITYYLHFFLARGKARRERIRQLGDALEERTCVWLEVLRSPDAANQERALNVYSAKRRLFFVALRQLKAILNKTQNEALAANCLNVIDENPPGTETPSELEHLLENLKRLYASQCDQNLGKGTK